MAPPSSGKFQNLVKMTFFRKTFAVSIYFVHFLQVRPPQLEAATKISIWESCPPPPEGVATGLLPSLRPFSARAFSWPPRTFFRVLFVAPHVDLFGFPFCPSATHHRRVLPQPDGSFLPVDIFSMLLHR